MNKKSPTVEQPFRTYYDGLQAAASDATSEHFDPELEPSLAQQHMKEDADINTIVRRAQVAGLVPQPPGRYVDHTREPRDLQEAFAMVEYAQERFAALPAVIRERFANNPIAFERFANDPKNDDEMVALGLIERKPREGTEGPKNAEKRADGRAQHSPVGETDGESSSAHPPVRKEKSGGKAD